ncbi:protein spaetzle [Diprion similis]|uniref:protein spaetzle n=1 Tax=Diprion similis TaxID=362088 RepID=UPI001EF92821|nr:protein spaetzle [Diprion similis]
MTLTSRTVSRRESPGRRISPLDQLPRNLVTVGLIFTTVLFEMSVSMPSATVSRSFDKHDEYVLPRTEHRWQLLSEINAETNRDTGRDGSSTGDIVFPDDESSPVLKTFKPGPDPACRDETFCEKTDSYPENYVSNLIKRQNDLKYLAVVDMVDDIAERFNRDDSTALCVTTERLIFPTAAQNKDNNWLFIVNQEGFRQGVRIETCRSPEGECSVIGGFATGYKTMCKQKYIYRQLAAISENGTAIRDLFKLPSSCCCHVKLESPYARMRIETQFNPT